MKRNLLIAAVLFFSAAAFSLEVKSEYTHIYNDDNGASTLKRTIISEELDDENGQTYFSFKADKNELKSSHKEINCEIKGYNFSSFIQNDYFGVTGRLGFFDTSKIKIDFGKRLKNGGATGLYFGFDVPFEIYDLKIKPSYYYGYVNFLEGDLAYFMGYPSVPYFMLFGTEVEYHKNHVQLIYLPLQINILTNDSLDLFELNNYIAGGLYYRDISFYAGEAEFNFQPFAGYFYAGGKLNGELTQKNQQVIYFVFDYFRVSAAYDIHSVLIGSNANLKYNFLKLNFDTCLFYILYENTDIKYSWKKLNKLAKWQEMLVWNSLNWEKTGSRKINYDELDKSGVFLCNLGAEINLVKNIVSVNINKTVFIPFSLNQKNNQNTQSSNGVSDEAAIDNDQIKNVLKSCLSVGVSIRL